MRIRGRPEGWVVFPRASSLEGRGYSVTHVGNFWGVWQQVSTSFVGSHTSEGAWRIWHLFLDGAGISNEDRGKDRAALSLTGSPNGMDGPLAHYYTDLMSDCHFGWWGHLEDAMRSKFHPRDSKAKSKHLAWSPHVLMDWIVSPLTSISLSVYLFLYVSIYFFICHTHGIWKFPGQGLNLSCSFDLLLSCGNAGCFNPLHQAGYWTCASAVTLIPCMTVFRKVKTFGA